MIIKAILIVITIGIGSSLSAQKKLDLYEVRNGYLKRSCRLPEKIICKFKDGSRQRCILDSLNSTNDTLYVRDKANIHYNIALLHMHSLRVNRTLNSVRDLVVVGGVGTSIVLTSLLVGYSTHPLYIVIYAPLTAGIGLGAYAFARGTRNTFTTSRYHFRN